MYGMNARTAMITAAHPRRSDPRVGQFWRDLLYGARGPRAPFPDPPPPPPLVIPPAPPPPPSPLGGPRGAPTQVIDMQGQLADALQRRPGQPPISDVPAARLPDAITCADACVLRIQPNVAAAVVASLGPGTRLTRIGSPIVAADGSRWVEASAELTINFNVRTVRGFVRLGELREAPVLLPPPPPSGGPPIATTPASGPSSFLRTAGEVVLLTSPAWGAFLISRLLR